MNLGVERILVVQTIITDDEPEFWIVPHVLMCLM
jgi:hypothetical protein